MELLKDKLINGISFEIIREEYKYEHFHLYLRVTNITDHRKKIDEIDMDYISIKHGLKNSSCSNSYVHILPNNTFFDYELLYKDIESANDGDRIEMKINDGRLAFFRLLREHGQWWIVESIERSAYNRELKSKTEHFEAIEEQFGIALQNFSVKVEDENSLKVFCEVLALNGEIPKNDFTINIAIYDNNNDIVYTDSEPRYAEDFKGFEVLTFDSIRLDITVDEISKIRIYPTR